MLEHWVMAGQPARDFWQATPREYISVMRGYRADLTLRGIIKPKSKSQSEKSEVSAGEGLRAWATVLQAMNKGKA